VIETPDFPRPTATVDPSVIWNYSTRTLTDFTGKPRSDLLGSDSDLATIGYTSARAAKLDNLDVAVSTRSSHTAADVWAVTTRTLTSLTGQPRIDLLGEDACVSEDTEILTEYGWKRYHEVKEGLKVLTLNLQTGKLEYQPINKVFIYEWDGEAYNIKTRNIDMVVSPKHRILVLEPFHYKKKWRYAFYTPEELPNTSFKIPVAGLYDGTFAQFNDELIKLLAWIITEGHLKHPKDQIRPFLVINQSAKHPDYLDEIHESIKALGYHYWVTKVFEGNFWQYDFYISVDGSDEILQMLDSKIHEIPPWMLNLKHSQLVLLRETLLKGDGHFREYITRKSRRFNKSGATFTTVSRINADRFQELCIKTGKRAIIKMIEEGGRIKYDVYVAERDVAWIKDKAKVKRIHYKGIMWCVQTSNGTFVARRNGRPFITGNSFEAGTGTRKALIDRLASMEAFDTPIEGSVTMDGTEKDVVLDEVSGNPQRFLEGYIDLSPMASGDTIVIRQYMKITATGAYVKYAEETYSGAQTLPLLYITTKSGRYGIKVTAQQTAGTYRSLTYQFFRRKTT